jgi:hypothetical protein
MRLDVAEYHTVSVYEVQSCKELAEYQPTLLSIRRLHTTRGLESGAKGAFVRSALGWKSCVERVRRILCNWCVNMLLNALTISMVDNGRGCCEGCAPGRSLSFMS